jgi:hypothetical protein
MNGGINVTEPSSPLLSIGLLLLAFFAYFLPAMIASKRNHPNAPGILLLDLFLGWTFIGWLAALIWSVSAIREKKPAPAPVAGDDKYQTLERLAALKEKGALTEQEYQLEKSKLLS